MFLIFSLPLEIKKLSRLIKSIPPSLLYPVIKKIELYLIQWRYIICVWFYNYKKKKINGRKKERKKEKFVWILAGSSSSFSLSINYWNDFKFHFEIASFVSRIVKRRFPIRIAKARRNAIFICTVSVNVDRFRSRLFAVLGPRLPVNWYIEDTGYV